MLILNNCVNCVGMTKSIYLKIEQYIIWIVSIINVHVELGPGREVVYIYICLVHIWVNKYIHGEIFLRLLLQLCASLWCLIMIIYVYIKLSLCWLVPYTLHFSTYLIERRWSFIKKQTNVETTISLRRLLKYQCHMDMESKRGIRVQEGLRCFEELRNFQ